MNKNEQLDILNKICPLYQNNTSKRKLRHDFFKNIETEIQAYLLGFHAADGNVNLERHTLRVRLTKTDSEIVQLFKEIISPEAYTRDVNGFSSIIRDNIVTTKTAYEVSISSKVLVGDIIQLGFGPNKTYDELHLPNIKEELMRHFIRGYFDGDGSIIGSVRKPNINNREKNYRVTRSFQIDCKKRTLMQEIKEFLFNYEINLNINYVKRDDLYRLVTASRGEVTKIFNFLYTDSNFYLQRKFDKFNYYVNTEVSQIIADHRNA
jgi:hypothetical protein